MSTYHPYTVATKAVIEIHFSIVGYIHHNKCLVPNYDLASVTYKHHTFKLEIKPGNECVHVFISSNPSIEREVIKGEVSYFKLVHAFQTLIQKKKRLRDSKKKLRDKI